MVPQIREINGPLSGECPLTNRNIGVLVYWTYNPKLVSNLSTPLLLDFLHSWDRFRVSQNDIDKW
jgi:hypothetical protein